MKGKYIVFLHHRLYCRHCFMVCSKDFLSCLELCLHVPGKDVMNTERNISSTVLILLWNFTSFIIELSTNTTTEELVMQCVFTLRSVHCIYTVWETCHCTKCHWKQTWVATICKTSSFIYMLLKASRNRKTNSTHTHDIYLNIVYWTVAC